MRNIPDFTPHAKTIHPSTRKCRKEINKVSFRLEFGNDAYLFVEGTTYTRWYFIVRTSFGISHGLHFNFLEQDWTDVKKPRGTHAPLRANENCRKLRESVMYRAMNRLRKRERRPPRPTQRMMQSLPWTSHQRNQYEARKFQLLEREKVVEWPNW